MTRYSFLILTVLTMLGNYLANLGVFGGESIGAISDTYSTLLTPAGFTFAIWSVIYTLLVGLGGLIAAKKLTVSNSFLRWYALSCALNVGWLAVWQNELFLAAAIVLVSLALVNFGIVRYLVANTQTQTWKAWPAQSYLVYATWTLLAAIINVTTWLQFAVGFEGFGVPGSTWAGGILWVLAGVALALVRFRNYLAFALVYLWAVFGIVSANSGTEIAAQGTTGALVVTFVLVFTVFGRRRLRIS